MTGPAVVHEVRATHKYTWFELTITEGKNRQVRRMCEAVGHPVLKLVRLKGIDVKRDHLGELGGLIRRDIAGCRGGYAGPPALIPRSAKNCEMFSRELYVFPV